MPGIGIHAARTGRGCSYALLLTTALLLLCFCARPMCSALHRTDIQLLRAPKFASSSTVTNSYTSIGSRARTHMCTLHTDQLVEENAAQTTGRKLCNLALPRTHTHTHTHIYMCTPSFLYCLCIVPVFCALSAMCAFCILYIMHCLHYFAHCVLCSTR